MSAVSRDCVPLRDVILQNLPAGIFSELSRSSACKTGTTTPTEKSSFTNVVQKYVELTSFVVTPSFSFPPRGKKRFATNVLEPDFPLGRNTEQKLDC